MADAQDAPQTEREEQDVRGPHAPERRHEPLVGETLAADQRHVVNAEHRKRDRDHHADATARKAYRDGRADQHEHDARERDRELLVVLDLEAAVLLARLARRLGLDRCELGPNMVIYPEGIWYTYKTREDLDALRTELAETDPDTPVVFAVDDDPAKGFQVYGSSKLAGNISRYGLPDGMIDQSYVYLGDVENLLQDRPTAVCLEVGHGRDDRSRGDWRFERDCPARRWRDRALRQR